MKKKLWIVYWTTPCGYTEFVELWSREDLAITACATYQESHSESSKKFVYEKIELVK